MAKTGLNEIKRDLWSITRREGIVIDQIPFLRSVREQNVDQLKEHLIERLKGSSYPFPATRKTRGTMLDRLQSKGVMNAFVSEPVLTDIKCALELFEIEQRERALQDKGGSSGNYDVQFHRGMLQAMFQHNKRVQKLLNEYTVPEQWMAQYSKAVYEQMKKEIKAISPLYPFGDPASLSRSWNALILSIYDILTEAFAKTELVRGRKALAIQLTAIICSPSDFFCPGTGVSPEAVRRIIQRRKKSGQKS